MRNILLTVSYDGTDFCGWQRQDFADKGKSVRTVQQVLEDALFSLHKQKINLTGSGRTDSGVHAFRQAANFFSPIDSIPVEKYPLALNSFLPEDVRIMEARIVPDDFSSRYSATSRVYRYFINTKSPFASQMRFCWPIYRTPNLEKLNKMASLLKGEMDCASFAASGDQSVSTNRYIECARFFYENENLVFEIEANAFLWKMVRTVVGTIIHFEQTGKDEVYFKKVIESKKRTQAGPTAPAKGLFLYEIKFDGVRRHP